MSNTTTEALKAYMHLMHTVAEYFEVPPNEASAMVAVLAREKERTG